MKLKDKVALITGASRGIGKATALLFAKEGAKIVVNYHSAEKEASEVVEQIKSLGSEALAVKCDVAKEDEVKLMINKTVEKFGKLDILVNNAGIVYDVPIFEKTVEQWKRTLEVNMIGTFLCTKYAVPHIKKGSIVNVASTNGISNFSSESIDYDASKAGILIMTKVLAKELAPNIRVNAVAPGWIDTDMNKDLPKDFVKEELSKVYLKRYGEADEIAKSILFLSTEADASFITGSTLKIDGGNG